MNSAVMKFPAAPPSGVIHHHALRLPPPPSLLPLAPPSSASSTSSPSPPLPSSPHDSQSPDPSAPEAAATSPVTSSVHGSAEAICEAAAKLLFMNIKWVKNVPAFVALPFSDQCSLLREAWRELFVLAAAQFQIPIDPATLLSAAGTSGFTIS